MTDHPNLDLLRAMSTGTLVLQLHNLENELEEAQTRPRKARYSAAYCEARITAIRAVLAEKGVTVTKLT